MRSFFLIAIGLLILVSCQKEIDSDQPLESTHPVRLQLKAMVGAETLEFGRQYLNSFNEPFIVSAFKFYLHDIRFVNRHSGESASIDKNGYHLADFSSSSSFEIQGSIPAGTYDAIQFVIGVDSILNVSGAQAGALDPLQGMFWTWNTGYIMAKLEGNTPVATTPNNAFQYHIGGFSGENSVVERLTMPFALGAFDTNSYSGTSVEIHCDILKWFNGDFQITLEHNPVCMTPGILAKQIATNYYKMFSIGAITEIR